MVRLGTPKKVILYGRIFTEKYEKNDLPPNVTIRRRYKKRATIGRQRGHSVQRGKAKVTKELKIGFKICFTIKL